MPLPSTDRKLLTDVIVRELAPPARSNKIYYDGGDPKKCVTGFGIRITASGARAFIFNYRSLAGRERRMTIGGYPEWSVKAAREKAKELRREVDGGYDPLAERIAEREAPIVNDLIARWRTDYAPRKREGSRNEDESLIRQWIAPELGHRKVTDVRRSDIDRLHRKITETGRPVRANRAVTLLSKLFTLAMRWDMRSDNPASGTERNHEQPRHRYLSGEELRRLTEALAIYPNRQAANAVRLLLLTGARRSEVLGATWEQFDLEAGVWVKPSAHTKQKREHRIPLSAPARRLLMEIKTAGERRAAEQKREPSCYVFPAHGAASRSGRRGAGIGRITEEGQAAAFRPVDRQAHGGGSMVEIKNAWAALCKAADLRDVRLHDLRHTYASVLASAGLSLPVIGALLGHTQPGTTARYAHLFDDPLRAATERVGAIVTRDSPKTAGDVITFTRG
jgi:integrase